MKLPGDYVFNKAGKVPPAQSSYNSSNGVLTVTLDMSKMPGFATDYAAQAKKQCQPSTFCKPAGNACACNTGSPNLFPSFLQNECNADASAICSWAVKDVDCPEGGCWGFGVKLADKFATTETPPNPAPTTQCFKKDPWNVNFSTISDTSDKCNYPNLPVGDFSCVTPADEDLPAVGDYGSDNSEPVN